jgi:hypothetical protein
LTGLPVVISRIVVMAVEEQLSVSCALGDEL